MIIAFFFQRFFKLDTKLATLIGVGSSICGGSAIAATAPVIHAKEKEVAQAISVIFFFNVLAALIFPTLGSWLHLSNEGFALFAGTAVNDTSSVTATASAWDSLYNANTLEPATIVKLTRTLAIIPIVLFLSYYWQSRQQGDNQGVKLKKIFPVFILYFILASLLTTLLTSFGVSTSFFSPLKQLSIFFIIMAMSAIGLKTNLIAMIKSSGKSILLGALCWIAIILTSLGMQLLIGIY
nr:putative sulfate exporter family transporter [Rothia sp. HMSC062F03]